MRYKPPLSHIYQVSQGLTEICKGKMKVIFPTIRLMWVITEALVNPH